jgi:hypothetical protein
MTSLLRRAGQLNREERWFTIGALLTVVLLAAFLILPMPPALVPCAIGVLLLFTRSVRAEARDRQRWPWIQDATWIQVAVTRTGPSRYATPTPPGRTPRRGRCPACGRNVVLHRSAPFVGGQLVIIGRHPITLPDRRHSSVTACPTSGLPLAAFTPAPEAAPAAAPGGWGSLGWALEYDPRITARIRAEFTDRRPEVHGETAYNADRTGLDR